MKNITVIFSENLRKLRKNHGLSQQQLAELVGVSVITIQNYEAQRRWPSPESIHDLAKALKVFEPELFADPEQKVSPEKVVLAVSEALGIAKDPARRSPGKRRTKIK